MIPKFRKTYQDEEGRQIKSHQEVWITKPLNQEGVSLAMFHEMFPLRNKYPYWYQDLKTDEDIIREKDIQIIRNWRSLNNSGPGQVLRTDYGFGLENIEGGGDLKGIERGMAIFKTPDPHTINLDKEGNNLKGHLATLPIVTMEQS